jgi:hypothetical protein
MKRAADANQHLRICRIALASTHPDAEAHNANAAVVAAAMQGEVLKGLKEMVAVARCNTHCISASWKAAHAVHKFAVTLQDDLDRSKMIEFLEEADAMGMPTEASVQYLKEQWSSSWSHYEEGLNQFS